MRYAFYTEEEQTRYAVAILVPTIRADEISQAYLEKGHIFPRETIVLSLHTAPGKKATPVKEVKEYIVEELEPTLTNLGVEYVLCANAEYFKALTGAKKAEPNLGYVMDSVYGTFKVIYVPNYRSRFYDPDKFDRQLGQGLTAIATHRTGLYAEPGYDVIRFAEYPQTYAEIHAWLQKLLDMDCPLTIDTENFSLKHHDSGLGTISFAWNQHEGIAFAVDYVPIPGATEAPFGQQIRNEPLRELLREFFKALTAKAIYHNISYDVYVMIYQLFMDHILDTEGLLEGLDVMLRNWDCTKLITYLATNSCAGNKLGLKENSQEFAGNYAQDEIHDITRIPLPELLKYNLIDALSTWYVHNKHYPTMIADEQSEIYETVFKPANTDIIQMQLTGLPINMTRVKDVRVFLEAISADAVDRMQTSPVVVEFTDHLNREWVEERNAKLKKKRVSLADANERFNPNSNPQLQALLYEQLQLPVLSKTDSGAPSADGDTLEALRAHTSVKEVIDLLNALIDYKAVDKILSSFIPAFETAVKGNDGWHYLFGNFNLGGTISGRLSSSKPNLQNLPANASMKISDEILVLFPELLPYVKKGKLHLGKLLKSCVEAPPGWLFCGLDFDSLEDRISALTTKDPNKLKVYTDGYDGHCLRAYSYFGLKMHDIDPTSVVSINSIAEKYPDERQASKVPTFLLTYGGTWMGIVQQTGLDKQKAVEVEASYHELYEVSDQWIDAKLEQATIDGYVTVAFGLRVRTPLLKQVVRKTSRTPHEAEAEGRSAGNAFGQSWCLLNSRAGSEFLTKVRSSTFRLDIRPCVQIHDAQYYLLRDCVEAVHFTNKHLVKAVQWQDHPDIYHPQVKLGGRLGIFYPTWEKEIEIPNEATPEEILNIVAECVA